MVSDADLKYVGSASIEHIIYLWLSNFIKKLGSNRIT